MNFRRLFDKSEKWVRRAVNKCLRPLRYQLIRIHKTGTDDENAFDEYGEFREIYTACKSYSMTSIERMFSLYKSVKYVAINNIPGDFVECGVWRGGSAMVIALSLIKFNLTDRNIYLYDTFDGMSEPSDEDVDVNGETAAQLMKNRNKDEEDGVWCYASFDVVKRNMQRTGYDESKIHYIQGKVEDTLPTQNPPGDIAVLRLDTDFYTSTKHELEHLYPKLVADGVLIADDYGHWQGAKQAIDEFFTTRKRPLLNRIDYTGRIAIKPTD